MCFMGLTKSQKRSLESEVISNDARLKLTRLPGHDQRLDRDPGRRSAADPVDADRQGVQVHPAEGLEIRLSQRPPHWPPARDEPRRARLAGGSPRTLTPPSPFPAHLP